jgi:PIN domain nuclease of toxin-antitoxin system
MKLLLDTHVLMWWTSLSERIPENILLLLDDIENEVFLSTASIWEMQIKCQNGKLDLGQALPELIREQ